MQFIEETRSSLQFASRAKNIATQCTVNEVVSDDVKIRRLERRLAEEVSRSQVGRLRMLHRHVLRFAPSPPPLALCSSDCICAMHERDPRRVVTEDVNDVVS